MDADRDDPDAFDHVIQHVMPVLYAGMREDALNAGVHRWVQVERFVTHDGYHAVRERLVQMLARLRADDAVAEFVLGRVLPEHRPPLH